MAAPTFQAEGTIAASATVTPPTPTIPTHVANDVLIASVVFWGPDPVASIDQIPTPSGWTLLGSQQQQPAGTADGWAAQFWKRASGAGTTITLTAGANWTSDGTTTCFAARVDVVRGALTTATPFDTPAYTGPHTTANQQGPAITVTGTERLGMLYGLNHDNGSMMNGTTLTTAGFTLNAITVTSTGSDAGFRVAYKQLDSNYAAGAMGSTSAPAQGAYFFAGFGVIPEPTPSGAHYLRTQYRNRRRRRL